MLLYLVRHGAATWPKWSGQDDERPLTPEGVRLIRAEARQLAILGIRPELIFFSPLVRARETARLIAEALALADRLREQPALRPGFDHKALLQVLRGNTHRRELMLVGHAPDMSDVVQTLTGGAVKYQEGTIACVNVERPEEALEGTLLWLATADLLAREF